MSSLKKYILFVSVVLGILFLQNSCEHEAIMGVSIDPDPMDTMPNNPGDTVPSDTTVLDTTNMDTTSTDIPCDSSKIYFTTDILPILNSSCALSGCHDAVTAEHGIILSSYEQIIASNVIEPFDLSESDLYEAITETDEDEIMPPSGRLDNEVIVKIAQWILQGADTLSCDTRNTPCGVETVSYKNDIASLMSTHCNGCHGTNVASGGIVTDNYDSVKTIAESGKLYGALAWLEGFKRMPQNLAQLDSCSLVNIKIWIDEGAQNN
jgi:hypothetical protein